MIRNFHPDKIKKMVYINKICAEWLYKHNKISKQSLEDFIKAEELLIGINEREDKISIECFNINYIKDEEENTIEQDLEENENKNL